MMRKKLFFLIAGWCLCALHVAPGASLTVSPSDFADRGKAQVTDGALSLYEAGTVRCAIDVPTAGPYTFILVARGDQAGGEAPEMEVTATGQSLLKTQVGSEEWKTYTFQGPFATGVHELAISFLNDYLGEDEDRNLYVKSLTLLGPGDAALRCLSKEEYGSLQEQHLEGFLREADERILKIRRGPLEVRVFDAEGKPVTDAKIRVRQKRHEFLFGTALCSGIFEGQFSDDVTEEFLKQAGRYFNHAVTENALKWPSMEPDRGEASYDVVDRILDWCEMYDIPLRGHSVFWGCEQNIPAWALELHDEELRSAICLRARVIAARYKGRMDEFDVNNEMMHCNYFKRKLGESIRRQMFHELLSANPQARLYVNDYGILNGLRVDDYVTHIRYLLESGVPVSGIGVQGHFDAPADPYQMWSALDGLAKFRLPIKITEFDCLLEDEDAQAACLDTVYRIAFSHPGVHGILMWGFWEKCHWRPVAAMLREDFSRKPAAETYNRLVFKDWWTIEEGWTDASGVYRCDAFFGEYEIIAERPDSDDMVHDIVHSKKIGSTSIDFKFRPKETEESGE